LTEANLRCMMYYESIKQGTLYHMVETEIVYTLRGITEHSV